MDTFPSSGLRVQEFIFQAVQKFKCAVGRMWGACQRGKLRRQSGSKTVFPVILTKTVRPFFC